VRRARRSTWKVTGVAVAVFAGLVAACAPSIPPPDGPGTAPTVEGLTFVPATWDN